MDMHAEKIAMSSPCRPIPVLPSTSLVANARRIVLLALAWASQRASQRIDGVAEAYAIVRPREERWCRDGDSVLLDCAWGVERLNAHGVERVGPAVLVREVWYDGPSHLYVLFADREVDEEVAASLRREIADEYVSLRREIDRE